MGHQLVGLFAGSIEADGVIDIVVDGEGGFGVGSVDGTGGSEDEVFDFRVATAFEDVAEANQVAVDVGGGILQGVTHSSLGGEVSDGVEALVGKELGHAIAIGQVALMEAEVWLLL